MTTFKAGIIGCGRMGSLFEDDPLTKKPCTHAGAYSEMDEIDLIAACDIREDRLQKFSEKWGVNRLYKEYQEMLDNEDLDIVSIATHAQDHKDICIAAAKSGVKAIFCEKPMATSLKEADEMISACKENNVVLVINHTRRWDSCFNHIKELIEKGEIGDITTLKAFSTVGFMNGGTHLFDLLRSYNGDVDEITGFVYTDKSTDPGGRAMIKFKNGSFCFLDAIWRDYVFFGVDIFGKRGMIKGSGMIRGGRSFELHKAAASEQEQGIFELKPAELDLPRWSSPITAAVNDMINAINTGSKVLCDGNEGRAAIEVALAIHESHNKGNIPVKLPLQNKDLRIIPRETSFTDDGKLVEK